MWLRDGLSEHARFWGAVRRTPREVNADEARALTERMRK